MESKEGCWRSEISRRELKRVRRQSSAPSVTDMQRACRCLKRCLPPNIFPNTHDSPLLCSVCNKMTKDPLISPFLCLDMTYITCLLKDGFGFKEHTVLQVSHHQPLWLYLPLLTLRFKPFSDLLDCSLLYYMPKFSFPLDFLQHLRSSDQFSHM